MKYFINPADNSLYAYEEDGSQDEIIPQHFIAATEEQIDAIIKKNASPNTAKLLQIVQLETTITSRRLREAALTNAGKAWLENIDNQIAALRAQLV